MSLSDQTVRIQNARIICPKQGLDFHGSLDLKNGAIAWLGQNADALDWDGEVIDAGGAILTSGFIDIHVRSGEPGYEYRETLDETAQAAARGGFTTVCLMANGAYNQDTRPLVEYVARRSNEIGSSRLRPIGALTLERKGERLTEMFDLLAGGAIAFSDFESTCANAGVMRRALEYAKATGRPVFEFPNNPSLSGTGIMHEGPVATRLGLKGIPSAAEEVRVYRAISLARLTGAPLHIGPVSTAASVAALRVAKSEGLSLTSSVLASHLKYVDADIMTDWSTALKVMPVLREESDRIALLSGVADGTIDAISSGHLAQGLVDKQVPFPEAEFGMLGLQTALSVCLEIISAGGMSLMDMVSRLTSGPMACLRNPWHGLAIGHPGDLVLFHPDKTWSVSKHELGGRALNTPLFGSEVKGCIENTWVSGRCVYNRADESSL
ncbi:MAG: dihydroorotase [Myxococcota bacterium]|nr:dihydroorotase [Myxococcota bacterium]